MSRELLVASGVLSDAATITSAATIAASMGIGNLTSRQPGDACRFLDGTDAHVVVDLGSSISINFAGALSVVGAQSSDTMRVRGATTEANLTVAPGFDPGTSSIWPKAGLEDWPFVHAARYIDPPQSFRFWRIDFAFAGTSIDVGRLMIDAAYVSPRAIDIGYPLITRSSTIARRSVSGGLHVVSPGVMWREIEASLNALTEAELLAGWLPLLRKVENSKDVFAWIDPGALTYVQERGLHGLVAEASQANAFFGDFYQARLRIIEQLPNTGIGSN